MWRRVSFIIGGFAPIVQEGQHFGIIALGNKFVTGNIKGSLQFAKNALIMDFARAIKWP